MIISGLDECGRGSLAGPLVGAIATINIDIEEFIKLLGTPLRDSKKLTKTQKNKIYAQKDKLPISYAVESISVTEINEKGIVWANTEVFNRLFNKIISEKYLVDGNIKFQNNRVESIIKGDNMHPVIMLASVIAKVYRDNLMEKLHLDFPQYHWHKNSGYGTKLHQEALLEFGATPHHRTLFIRNFIKQI